MPQIYQNQFASIPERDLSWGQLYDFIRTHNHRSFVHLRNPSGDVFWDAEKKDLKSKLPMFSPNVILDGVGTKRNNIIGLSGSLFVDVDGLSSSEDELNNAKECLIKIPYVSAVWVSPSGCGLHIIVNVNIKHLSLETFAECWKYAMLQLKEESGIGGKWDEVVHNPERRVYVSQDSRLLAKEVLAELNIPKRLVSPSRANQRTSNGESKAFNSSKDFDKLHSSILIPPTDFVLRLSAENMNPEGSEILRSGDLQSEVGLWFAEGFMVPDLGWYRLAKIQEGNRNAFLANHITKWLWLNQPYLKEEAMWNYANILHQRVEKSGEYKTPYPIYNQIKYFFRNFDPNKTNPNSMKQQHAFFLKKSDLTRADKSLIARIPMGLAYNQETIAAFESLVVDSLERLHTKLDIYPSKAKITIHTIFEFMLAVYKVGGGDKLCLKKLYKFCNGSEAIKLRLAEVNVGRPFTKEAALKWEIYEEILRLQPERPISDIIKENDAKSNSRQTFYDLKAKSEALSEGLRGNSLN